jgi:hypothetical protein
VLGLIPFSCSKRVDHREDAERFLEDVRRDDAELAEWLRVESVELDA